MEKEGGANLHRININDSLNRVDAYGLDSCKLAGPLLVVKPSWWKFWRPHEEVYWGTPAMYEKIVGKVNLQNAIEAAAIATAAATLTAGTADGHGKTPIPERDETGKVHGDLPSYVPKDWTSEQLQDIAEELQKSIDRRKQEQEQLGEDGPHRKRISEEEDLLRQINRKLCE